jgi:hypothetical protein
MQCICIGDQVYLVAIFVVYCLFRYYGVQLHRHVIYLKIKIRIFIILCSNIQCIQEKKLSKLISSFYIMNQ